jgi:hypothetical protein
VTRLGGQSQGTAERQCTSLSPSPACHFGSRATVVNFATVACVSLTWVLRSQWPRRLRSCVSPSVHIVWSCWSASSAEHFSFAASASSAERGLGGTRAASSAAVVALASSVWPRRLVVWPRRVGLVGLVGLPFVGLVGHLRRRPRRLRPAFSGLVGRRACQGAASSIWGVSGTSLSRLWRQWGACVLPRFALPLRQAFVALRRRCAVATCLVASLAHVRAGTWLRRLLVVGHRRRPRRVASSSSLRCGTLATTLPLSVTCCRRRCATAWRGASLVSVTCFSSFRPCDLPHLLCTSRQ